MSDASPIYLLTLVQYGALIYWTAHHYPLFNTALKFKKGVKQIVVFSKRLTVRLTFFWLAVVLFFFNIGRVIVEMGMYFVFWTNYSELVQVDIGLWALVPKVASEILRSDIIPFYRFSLLFWHVFIIKQKSQVISLVPKHRGIYLARNND
jgi:hypothetical protein